VYKTKGPFYWRREIESCGLVFILHRFFGLQRNDCFSSFSLAIGIQVVEIRIRIVVGVGVIRIELVGQIGRV